MKKQWIVLVMALVMLLAGCQAKTAKVFLSPALQSNAGGL